MNRFRILVVTAAVLIGIGGSTVLAGAAGASTRAVSAQAAISHSAGPGAVAAASVPTLVYGFGDHCPPTQWRNPMVRPTKACFGFAGEAGIRHISWRYWHLTSAYGRDHFLVFTGFGFRVLPGTVRLSRVRHHNGHRYFSHMVLHWTNRSGKTKVERMNWGKVGNDWLWH